MKSTKKSFVIVGSDATKKRYFIERFFDTEENANKRLDTMTKAANENPELTSEKGEKFTAVALGMTEVVDLAAWYFDSICQPQPNYY